MKKPMELNELETVILTQLLLMDLIGKDQREVIESAGIDNMKKAVAKIQGLDFKDVTFEEQEKVTASLLTKLYSQLGIID
ncbi:hypothetical protein LLR47_20035 [Bacillus cereus]|uniref:hypothetical protein n=1 Tax=Bacillus cereus TaxID=1396 RepID=UPI001D15572E|nr:hypothetical protein [Bacillus cereus]MCC3687497.1 hypothetical protein [Bacillus cereus]